MGQFDPIRPLVALSDHDAFRLKHAFEGVHIFGGNGSGKTSGPGAAFIKAYMRAGMGGLVLAAKPDEYALIEQYARETGALNRLIRFAPEEKWRFNWMSYLQRLPSRGAGRSANIVKTLLAIQDSFDRGESAGAKQEKFWKNILTQLLSSAVDLGVLARPHGNLSVEMIHEIITSAPTSPAQVDDPEWQAHSLCYGLLGEALQNEALTERQKSDLKLTGKFWLNEFPSLPSDTRGSAVSTYTTMADSFLRGDMAELFATGLNIVPDMTFDGTIWVVDLPVKVFGHVGLAAQILIKHIWCEAVERRVVSQSTRPVMCVADEAHHFVNEHLVQFLTTARSSRACVLLLSQTLANYAWSMGGGDAKARALTDSLMGVLQTKIFCSNSDPKTNQWAADVFGKEWQQKNNFGTSRSDMGNRSSNAGSSDSFEYLVTPAEFTRLRKGGPPHFLVDSIIHGGGRTFNASGQQYLKTTFQQSKGK